MIVALHGFTGSPAMWSGFDCTPLAILGHSRDCEASGSETFTDEVDRLAGQLPTGTHHLLGYSLGARLALSLALRFPDRVSEITLIGGSPGLENAEERRLRRRSDKTWSSLLRERGIVPFVDSWQSLPIWSSQSQLDAGPLAKQRKLRLAHDPIQLAHAMDILGTGAMPPLWRQLAALSIPVHIVVGQLDDKFHNLAREMKAQLPNARLSTVENTGHNPVFENPSATAAVLRMEYSL